MTAIAWSSLSGPIAAKPVHFEDLKNELIALNVRCTDCHVAPDDPSLTVYGSRLAALGADRPVAERLRELETDPSRTASDEALARAATRRDVDGDGIVNWIEILAGTDPSIPGPRGERHLQIETVISCKLCHTSISRFPVPGKEKAPHNAFGDALEEQDDRRRRSRRPRDEDRPMPIVSRLHRMKARDTDHDGVKDWDELTLFHRPADADDTPNEDEVKEIRKLLKARKRDKNVGFGEVHKAKRRGR